VRIGSYSYLGWASIGAIVGGIVPVATTAFYWGLDIGAGRELVVVWPSSLGLMAIQPSTPYIHSAIIWSVCAVLNVIFYSLIATMLYGLHRLVIGRQ
jgi:hypothetical protein